MEPIHGFNGVSLRMFQIEDRDMLVQLGNNSNVARNLRDGFPHPYTKEDAVKFIEDALSTKPTNRLCIEKNGVYVGNIGLHQSDDIYRMNAEIGYFVGEPHWGKGIASEAVRLMVEYGFNELKLNRIEAGVFSYNIASKKVLKNVGFEYEGTAKESIYKNGEYYDEMKYGILNPSNR